MKETDESTADGLAHYRSKRVFAATPEPKGKRGRRRKSWRFVIQKHAASHLHYDFRLELDGALKSWAVPKGPSLDPHDKRLAMHVEDHPLEYADFEGVIPPGNYGAGTVIVWDNGEWEPIGDPQEGYRKGRLKFLLHGEKLHGQWNLVRGSSAKNSTGEERQKSNSRSKSKEAWFLIKHADSAARAAAECNVVEELPDSVFKTGSVLQSDSKTNNKSSRDRAALDKSPRACASRPQKNRAQKNKADTSAEKLALPVGARAAALPLMLAPQLAVLVDTVPTTSGWIFEMKFDGYRLLTRVDGDSVRLFTRNGNDWTGKLPQLTRALKKLNLTNGWLDGEIVVLNQAGRPSFQLLQNAFENHRTTDIQYYLFDLPFANGFDLRNVALTQRRALLSALLAQQPAAAQQPAPLHFSEAFDAPPRKLFKHACAMQWEGLIGKRANAAYQSTRSRDWIKLKCLHRQEFVIGGFTDPSGARAGAFGALLLGVYEAGADKLRYVGRVGTGFTNTTLRTLMAKLKPLVRAESPFADPPSARATHWVAPRLIGEVTFAEWTGDGQLRHASFQGLRSDKPPSSITAEQAVPLSASESDRKKSSVTAKMIRISQKKPRSANTAAGVAISHGDRIIDTQSGITKRDLADFYEQVAPLLLPQLAERPVSLVRAPAGIDGPHFFQKHLNGVDIPHVLELDRKLYPGHPPLVAVNSLAALMACIQMNVIEFHTWNATIDNLQHPDRMIFDLDPGEGVGWAEIQQGAVLLKTLLDECALKSYLKTSGGKGLHVVVPIEPVLDWAVVKAFSKAVVTHLAATLPTLFVAKSGPKNRVKKIFVDYLRNGFGATTCSAYSVRARAGLGVSVPVAWSHLKKLTGSAQWSVGDVTDILVMGKKQPWQDLAARQQNLQVAADKLGIAWADLEAGTD